MAQGSNGWQGHSYPNGIGGMPVPQREDHLNNFNGYQQYPDHQYSQPDLGQYSNASPFPGYPSLQSGSQFGGGSFAGGSMPEQASYYPNAHQFNNDPNGSGLHGHGGHDLQQYGGAFNNHTGYEAPIQNQLPPQYVAEQASQTHSHTPNSFDAQSWQTQPVQQMPPQFNQRTIGYSHHGQQLMYQQQPPQQHPQQHSQQHPQQHPQQHQLQPQPQPQQPHQLQPQLQHQQHQMPYTGAFFGPEGAGPQNGQGHFTPQPSQPMLQYGRQHVNGTGAQMQPISVTTPQNFIETQRPVQPQQYQQVRGVVSAPTPPTIQNSSTTQIVGPQVLQEVPDEEPKVEDEELWEIPEGFPHLMVKNPPKTKTSKFRILSTEPSKSYAAKHDTRTTRLLPQRSLRLPCEIQRDIQDLNSKLQSKSLPANEKIIIENRIQELYNEPVLVADNEVSKPISRGKVKAPAKRKSSTMDSTKKSDRSATGGDEPENPRDIQARELTLKPRPEDSLKAVEYDVIKILWHDPKSPELSPDALRNSIDRFGDYVTGVRAQMKMLKEATDKSKEDKQAALDTKHLEIRTAIETALNFGDRFLITQLGTHKKLVAGLHSVLFTRFTAGDYNGPYPKAILKLLSLFATVDKDLLEKVKMGRTQQKVKGNLDDEAAGFISLIIENAEKRSAFNAQENTEESKKLDEVKKSTSSVPKKALTTAKDGPSTAKASPSKTPVQPKKPATGVKKMRPTDYSGLGSARKISNVTPKTTPSLASSKRPGDEDVDTRSPKKTAIENETGTSVAKATTTTTPTSQTSSVAATQARSRPTSSMLPGRSRVPPKAQPRRPAPQPSGSSAIGNILDEITRSKEQPKPRDEPERAPETPEETARRIRKESRRHLRVSWKPDHELTDIRILEHDTSEDRGRDDSMLRDARDNRSEGRMFKQRQQSKDRDTQNRDDDFEENQEVALRTWYKPVPFAFDSEKGHIPLDNQAKNFVTRGGKRPVESDQKKIMEEYESRQLMAVYTSVSEIPDTPRSPSGRFVEVFSRPKIVAVSSTPAKWLESLPATTARRVELHQRSSDQINFGPHLALDRATRRLRANPITAPDLFDNTILKLARPRTEKENAQEVLSLLQSDKVKNYVDPDPYDPAHPKTQRRYDYADPKVQKDADALEEVFARFKGKPYPATQPPEHLHSNPDRVMEWWDGYNRTLMPSAPQPAQPQLQPQYNPMTQYQPQPPQPQVPHEFAAILQQVKVIQAGQAATQPTAQYVPQPYAQPVAQPIAQPVQSATEPAPNQVTVHVRNLLAALNTAGGIPAAAPPPAPAPVPAPVAAPTPNLDIQSILARLNPSNNTTASQAQPAANAYYQGWPQNQSQPEAQTTQGYGNYGYNAQSYSGQSQYSQPQAAQTENRRDDNERGNRKDFHRGGGTKDHKGINRSLIGTKPCTFWAKGLCAKGDKCTFRHDPNDLKQ
ncbi:hypothetical protein F4806DRAFT_495873 [Annulohypoxylon nitens]|nr:hypothetical protein F4806DRAFT_495873 [Annulohypoxylon nitens]